MRQHESTLQKTNQGRYISTIKRGTNFWVIAVQLWLNLPKFSKSFSTDYIAPLGSLLLKKTALTRHQVVLDHNIISTCVTPRSDFITLTLRSEEMTCGGKKNYNVQSTHYTKLKQAHLFGIILETIWLILIGNTCRSVS